MRNIGWPDETPSKTPDRSLTMAQKITRDELIWLLEELERGEADREDTERLVASLELSLSDAEALDILDDDELTPTEMADRLVGYSDLDA